jgi:ERCC4-type nuclease
VINVGLKIIQDTREKKPWEFDQDWIDDVIVQKLDYGDYSLYGYERSLCIERKRNTAEIANNMIAARFTKLLNNISNFQYPFLICEFSISDIVNFPIGSGLPKRVMHRTKVSAGWMLSFMSKISIDYGINIIYAGNRHYAQIYAAALMKKFRK